ncbi:eukaryotic translation initiation factor 4E-binding protein 3-like [Sinocyclocheilus grahami]|uniref:Eukaryotic translation initiation factor 4E-binding protein 3-like n=1 Tax=Sinocyclocheilus grahami TaxID=75366 RepID=A0A672SS77_SINGR|nr:PREDICTED: eukaryotic translation initiation factor 4E-binding protein 3-like [Sinocyclocheilus grahami]
MESSFRLARGQGLQHVTNLLPRAFHHVERRDAQRCSRSAKPLACVRSSPELRFSFIMSSSCEASTTCPIPSRSSWPPLPDSYSQTPGGTLFSTTPGGSRIIYDRKFLLECRNSPITRTPPCCLPHIPGVTRPLLQPGEHEDDGKDLAVDDNQFVMDM